MQNIDFRKIAPKQAPSTSGSISRVASESSNLAGIIRLVSIVIIIATISFVVGVYVGSNPAATNSNHAASDSVETTDQQAESSTNEASTEVNTSNIANNSARGSEAATKPSVPAVESAKDSYLILGKIYSDRKDAHRNGLALKRGGLPVFLTESGKRMKLYIGPIAGVTKAYEMLAKVKKMPQFKGAILYKK